MHKQSLQLTHTCTLWLTYIRSFCASALSARKKSCDLLAPTAFLRYSPTLNTIQQVTKLELGIAHELKAIPLTFSVQSDPSEVAREFSCYISLSPGWKAHQSYADLGVNHWRPGVSCRDTIAEDDTPVSSRCEKTYLDWKGIKARPC